MTQLQILFWTRVIGRHDSPATGWYWSSSPCEDSINCAWGIRFRDGTVDADWLAFRVIEFEVEAIGIRPLFRFMVSRFAEREPFHEDHAILSKLEVDHCCPKQPSPHQ